MMLVKRSSCHLGVYLDEKLNFTNHIKGCVCYIFDSYFLSVKESTCETKKSVFYFTSKDLLFLRKSNFRILDI